MSLIYIKQYLSGRLRKLNSQKSLLKCHIRKNLPIPYKTLLHKPIFILGSSRSGTTMLVKTLAASSDLCCFNEQPIVRHQMWRMVTNPHLISQELPELEKRLVRLSGIKTGQRLLEKTPGHSLLAESLLSYFPDAQFIHIIRDGRDVALSMLKHRWIARELKGEVDVFWFDLLPDKYQKEWQYLDDWERGVLRWAIYVNQSRKISSYTQNYLEISYEDICQAPQEYINKILSFLQLDSCEKLDRQIAKIKTQSSQRWRKENLTSKQLEFYQRILTEFKVSICYSIE